MSADLRRQQNENPLLENERKYRSIVENMNDAFYIHDLNGTIIDCNDNACRMLGYGRDELVGAHLSKIDSPESGRLIEHNIKRIMEIGKVIFDSEQVRKDGSRVAVNVSARFVSIQGKNIIQSFVRDITDRRIVEEELRKSEERLRASEAKFRMLVENTRDIVFSVTREGRFDYISPATRSLGFEPEEIIGNSFLEFVHVDDRERMSREFGESLASGRETPTELRLTSKDGRVFWMEESGKLKRDPAGTITGINGALRDITTRKASEEALRASEEMFAKAFRSGPMAIGISKLYSGEFIDVNDEYLRIIEYRRDEVLGRTGKELGIWADPAQRDKIVALIKAGKGKFMEAECRTKTGKILTVVLSAETISWKGIACLLVSAFDITNQKRAEEALVKAERLESLGHLAGGIAHDFNNFLGGVFGYLEMAKEHAGSGNTEKTVYCLDKALRSFDRTKGLTKQFLTFAKGGAPVKKTGDLSPLVRESVAFALSGSNVRCSFALQEDLWPCGYDEHQIGQVVDNIVINAKQAMPGGGTIDVAADNVSIAPGERPPLSEGRYVRLSFKDSGPGIPEELRRKIYDPFFTTKKTGSGLGLATTWSIVKRHNGHIDLVSAPGSGTTFFIWLPAFAGTAEAAAPAAPPPVISKVNGRVLVMDDEPGLLRLTLSMLKSLGYRAIGAKDGDEAVERFARAKQRKDPFAAVLLDLTVAGGMGGKEAAQKILAIDPAARLIVSSGYCDDPVMALHRDYGFSGRLEKPFKKSELADALATVIQGKKVGSIL
jgi:two-component system, cell cycle sensor histidine kinase and response regulator CckA